MDQWRVIILRELLLAKITQMGWDPKLLACTVLEQVGLLQQLMQAFLIDCLSGMVDGNQRLRKMVMLRTL